MSTEAPAWIEDAMAALGVPAHKWPDLPPVTDERLAYEFDRLVSFGEGVYCMSIGVACEVADRHGVTVDRVVHAITKSLFKDLEDLHAQSE